MGQKGTISRRRTAVVSCANYVNLAIDEDFRRRKWPLMAKKATFSIFQTSPSSAAYPNILAVLLLTRAHGLSETKIILLLDEYSLCVIT